MTMAYDLALLLTTTRGRSPKLAFLKKNPPILCIYFRFRYSFLHFHWTPDWIFGTRQHQPIKTLSHHDLKIIAVLEMAHPHSLSIA